MWANMTKPRNLAVFALLGLTVFGFGRGALALPATPAADGGYPTPDRVDYVIGCMAANGNTHLAMMKCACSIDAIAQLVPYTEFERASTALSMQAAGLGDRAALFRDPPEIKSAIEHLHQAQAEADLQCFK